MELSQKQAGPASGSPLPAPSRTPKPAWAAADGSGKKQGSLRRQPGLEETSEGRRGQAESSEQTLGQRLPGGRGPLAEPGTSGRPQTWARGQPQAPAVGCPEFTCVCVALSACTAGPLFCEVSGEQSPGGLEAQTTLCTLAPARF